MVAIADIRMDVEPMYHTGNLYEAQRHLNQEARRAILEVAQPRLFRGFSSSFFQLGRIGLSMTTISSPEGHELSFRPDREYCLNLPLAGKGWLVSNGHVEEIKQGQAALIAPCGEVQKHWLGSSEVLTVHIPSEIFDDPSIMGNVGVIGAITIFECAGIESFIDIIASICKSSSRQNLAIRHPSVASHLEGALLALMAQMLPQRTPQVGSEPKSPAVPYYVRRAERFMRANFRPGISLDHIADAAGVSRRTLQYGFKTYHDTTPMNYFKKLRLSEARSILEAGRSTNTLTDLAFDLGYVNASHFTSDYREMFGETPSRTAARCMTLPQRSSHF